MVSYKGYVAGWLDSSIGDFVATLPNAFSARQRAGVVSAVEGAGAEGIARAGYAVMAFKGIERVGADFLG